MRTLFRAVVPVLTPLCYRGITFILQAILFRIVPTALEISLVCGILVSPSPAQISYCLEVLRDVMTSRHSHSRDQSLGLGVAFVCLFESC